ncbi:predicted protein [Uncinocarpus reesii 1704]|uniref:Uncharacterized protein n=1 Tax=Uncinocarpus reesii (strain UAMH 1704) TaxID=336963 RepID=C4JDC2_UNCRE|nr:uncharacterized protein UREG_00682 [Uncinocarpus reesii 1704]EEP75835.1 predicted protein [Uncinocarpus reesii 1704]
MSDIKRYFLNKPKASMHAPGLVCETPPFSQPGEQLDATALLKDQDHQAAKRSRMRDTGKKSRDEARSWNANDRRWGRIYRMAAACKPFSLSAKETGGISLPESLAPPRANWNPEQISNSSRSSPGLKLRQLARLEPIILPRGELGPSIRHDGHKACSDSQLSRNLENLMLGATLLPPADLRTFIMVSNIKNYVGKLRIISPLLHRSRLGQLLTTHPHGEQSASFAVWSVSIIHAAMSSFEFVGLLHVPLAHVPEEMADGIKLAGCPRATWKWLPSAFLSHQPERRIARYQSGILSLGEEEKLSQTGLTCSGEEGSAAGAQSGPGAAPLSGGSSTFLAPWTLPNPLNEHVTVERLEIAAPAEDDDDLGCGSVQNIPQAQ